MTRVLKSEREREMKRSEFLNNHFSFYNVSRDVCSFIPDFSTLCFPSLLPTCAFCLSLSPVYLKVSQFVDLFKDQLLFSLLFFLLLFLFSISSVSTLILILSFPLLAFGLVLIFLVS